MIALLSPAIHIKPAAGAWPLSSPEYEEEADFLANKLREYSPWQLESLMKCNSELAMRAFGWYQDFKRAERNPAVLLYSGMAYTHLGAAGFSEEELGYADGHLRLCSALYGLLRPRDGIKPHRLEMRCPIEADGKGLYEFWGDKLYRSLFREGEPVVSLTSAEYSKAVDPWLRPGDPWVRCAFYQQRRGKRRCLATSAKAARGRMARFIIKNRLVKPEQLKGFCWEGYRFLPELSGEREYVFLQEERLTRTD